MTTDEYIIALMKKVYGMSKQEIEEFKSILSGFTEQEKEELAVTLWEKYQQEESIFKKLFRKLKNIGNSIEEFKTKKEADQMLLDL